MGQAVSNPMREQSPAPLLREPSPLPSPLDDTRQVIALISDVLGYAPEHVRTLLLRNELDFGVNFREEFSRANIEPFVWSDRMEEFYNSTDLYAYGAFLWNRRPLKVRMREWIGRYLARDGRPFDVMTIGDGVGIDSLYLGMWGHRVTYSELSWICMEFARRLFPASPVPIEIVEGAQNVPSASQDVVVCLDVLEHLPDPGWMVGEIARCLRPGGRLVVHAPFFYVSPMNPTHLKSNQRYSGDWRRLYHPHGLTPIDGRPFWDPLILRKDDPDRPPPRVSPRRRLALACGGALLKVGRVWNAPHNFIAQRACRDRDPRWERELIALDDTSA